MPTSHTAETIQASCLMAEPKRESTKTEWCAMLWTLAYLDTEEEN